jgi:hypothetical protein
MPSASLEVVRSAHLSHVATLLRHIQSVRGRNGESGQQPGTTPSELFLARDETSHFWELIGLRARGHAALILGAIRFPRQPSKKEPYARRSLVHYLCSPPKELGTGGIARPAGMVEVALPFVDERIPDFLDRFRDRTRSHTFFMEADHLDFAFDFRVENPSEDRHVRMNQRHQEVHVVRTIGGHVLSGRSEGLHTKLHKDGAFLALSEAIQYTPDSKLLLPNLALHRRFLAMDAVCSNDSPLGEWTERSVPFLASLANATHLLEMGTLH